MDTAKRSELKRRGRNRFRWVRDERRRFEFNQRRLRHTPGMAVPTIEFVGCVASDGSLIPESNREQTASHNREQREVRWKQEMARRKNN